MTTDRNDISLREGTERWQSVNLLFSTKARHFEVQVGKGKGKAHLHMPRQALRAPGG